MEQTTTHCNKQRVFDVYRTKSYVFVARMKITLGVSTNKCNDPNINGIILKKNCFIWYHRIHHIIN